MFNLQILNRINAREIHIPFNKINYELLCLLEKEGFIKIKHRSLDHFCYKDSQNIFSLDKLGVESKETNYLPVDTCLSEDNFKFKLSGQKYSSNVPDIKESRKKRGLMYLTIEGASTKGWEIRQVSKPSRRIYLNYSRITELYKFGLGVSIFKTSRGLLTDKECI